jgi:hypothetical protein
VKRTAVLALGVALLVLGLPLTIRALLLMYDTATTTQIWMLREFGLGVCLGGWGIALVIPNRRRRLGIGLMTLGTVEMAAGLTLLSQGMPG